MIAFIQKRLDLKIILVLAFVIACMIGTFTYFDIKNIRSYTIRTSERTLGAFAVAIKGSVNASMKKGHHEDVRSILEEVNTPFFIDRIMIYSEQGRPLNGIEKLHEQSGLDMSLPPDILDAVVKGDLSDIRELGGSQFISYYSPIDNLPECFRCHGSGARFNGILRIDFSLRDLDDLVVARRNHDLFWSVFLIVFLTSVLIGLLRVVVYRPVKELRDAMANIQEGVDPLTLSIQGKDELADLKRNFVGMLNRINTLHRTNVEKEKEIAHSQDIIRFRSELQAMFDAMLDGVLLIDPGMNIIQSNRRAFELLPELKTGNGRIPSECLKDISRPHHGLLAAFRDAKVGEHLSSFKLPDGRQRHMHSICAPIIENGRVAYIVEVIRDITERVKTERELMNKTAELIVANKMLSQLASTDSLTQIYNRHRFDEILAKEIKRYTRRKYAALSLMMIDIDFFKKLNDQHGHLAGDAVLREIATLLKEGVRETDTVARYGGEEFVIVMPDTTLDGAAYKAEVLRRKTDNKEFPGQETPFHITISIGVANYTSGTPSDLIQAADQALYKAKNSGRNAVVVSRPEGVAT